MITLSSITQRLGTQFLDPHGLAAPQEIREEAVRLALEEINLSLNHAYGITGLDGELTGELPESFLPALFSGAAAILISTVLHYDLSSHSNLAVDRAQLQLWTEHLKRQFDLQLDKLRLQELQNAQSSPHLQWEWQENGSWR
jgi:hypothetical protein